MYKSLVKIFVILGCISIFIPYHASAYNFTKSLKRGSSGREVVELQKLLKTDPDIYPAAILSGYFGAMTEKAVKKFQIKYQIIKTEKWPAASYGVVDKETRTRLNQLSSSLTLQNKSSSNSVIAVPQIESKTVPTAPIIDIPPSRAQLPPKTEKQVCPGVQSIVLVVDPLIAQQDTSFGLHQFENDLCVDGYGVIEQIKKFNNPQELRSYLYSKYESEHLVGAILIGDFPRAYQTFTTVSNNPQFPPFTEEVLSLQYYEDLNGIFRTSTGYMSAGNHVDSYDIHEGNMDWEIWISVLPYYKGDIVRSAEAINHYFIKNHAYRTGAPVSPREFAQIDEHFNPQSPEQYSSLYQSLRSGMYAWTPFSNGDNAKIYMAGGPADLSREQGYINLTKGMADFTVIDSHGSWASSGQIDINWVESNPVKTSFFWSNGCAVGNLDYQDNFLTSVLYSPTSEVLIAKGTTNNSGGMGANINGFFGHNIATALYEHKNFGQAVIDHVNVPLAFPWNLSRELHFATSIILGDPTLKLRQ